MQKRDQPFETSGHDWTGYAALDFPDGNFNSFASLFGNYNPERFEPVTIKISLEGGSFTLTLYALDKTRKTKETKHKKELPVKKFKRMIEVAEFAKHIYHFAASLSNDKFNIEEMLVINK